MSSNEEESYTKQKSKGDFLVSTRWIPKFVALYKIPRGKNCIKGRGWGKRVRGVVAILRPFEIIWKMYDVRLRFIVAGSLYKTMRENKAIYFFRGECTFKMIPKGFKAKNVALAQLAKLKSTFPPREFGSIPFLALWPCYTIRQCAGGTNDSPVVMNRVVANFLF